MAEGRKDYLLSLIREGRQMRFSEQLQLTLLLSVPAILAQLSSVMRNCAVTVVSFTSR